ncbi:MAG TPA: hypothetical protein VFZ42_13735 [Chitinophagaceae bacterium]
MRIILLLTFLFTLFYSASTQDIPVIGKDSTSAINDTSSMSSNPSSIKVISETVNDEQQQQSKLLANLSKEKDDRKKKSLVRIGIGVVFLIVLIAGWRRRKLAK